MNTIPDPYLKKLNDHYNTIIQEQKTAKQQYESSGGTDQILFERMKRLEQTRKIIINLIAEYKKLYPGAISS